MNQPRKSMALLTSLEIGHSLVIFTIIFLASIFHPQSSIFAATITGTITSTANTPLSTNITFAPLSTPQANGNNTIPSTISSTTSAANGTFTITLNAGDYKVTIGNAARDSFIITVPTNSTTYQLNSLITSALAYNATVSPANELKLNKGQTNGYASLNANALIPAVQLATGTPNTGTYLRGDGTWSTANDPTALKAANNGNDFANIVAARKNLGVMDINIDSGISGGPEYAWTNSTPTHASQLGIVRNNGTTALYSSTGTSKGNWWGNLMINGALQVGTQSYMSNFTGSSIGLNVWANGNPNLVGTNGPAQGTEITALLQQPDPRQGTYICFGAPSGWDGVTQTPIMGAPVDFSVGLGGFLYGTNTLGGVAIDRDAIIALNPPVDLFFTTTVNSAPYGCRSFLSYDNLNGVWHFPVDRPGNGAPGNPGYQDVLTIDTRNKTIVSTNTAVTLTGGIVNLGPSASFQIAGANQVVIGTASGQNNTGDISCGKFSLNTAGTLLTPSIVNRAGSAFQYLNFDSSGNTQIGRFVNGTSSSDVYLQFAADHSHGWLNQPMKVGNNSSPATCAILDVQSTSKGLLLPRMTKLERQNISSPVAGLTIYQTDNIPGLRVFNGSTWMRYTEIAD